ncbi:MAG: C45 family peptidase [Ardenticatenaceae bacterium]|nr:C45 family peptidase [Ardenticatenaceae bacterium]
MNGSTDFPVLELTGTARNRGRVHGEVLRDRIHEMVERWEQDIGDDTGMNPDDFLSQLVGETRFLPAVKRWTPDLLEEVEGIAEGANVDFTAIFARQLSDEEPWFRLEKKLGLSWDSAAQCTAIGVSRQGERPALAAQNMDTPAYYNGFQVLLHIKYPESPLEAFMFTIAGKINLAGLNNAPVGVCCNTVLALNYAKDGLPEDFVVRGALAQPSLAEALAFMHRIRHASGQNYLIGGPERVISLECSANQIVEFVPYPGANRTYHTNHPLVNDDQTIHRERLAAMTDTQRERWGFYANSHARLDTLQRHLNDPDECITIDKIKTILSSHDGPVCHNSATKISLGCLIMELSPNPTLHLAAGPPCSTPFTTYRF